MKKIVFICQHNSCRSQIAECIAGRILDKNEYEITSAGVYQGRKINEKAERILKRMYGNEALKGQHVKTVTDEMLESADRLIVIGTDVDVSSLKKHEIEVWDITDPSGGEDIDYISAIGELKKKIKEIK